MNFKETQTRNKTAGEVARVLKLPVTTRCVQQILQQDKGLKWNRNMMPPHTQGYKTARLKFARNHMICHDE